MIDVVITIVGTLLYIATTVVLLKQLPKHQNEKNKKLILWLSSAAVIFHADMLARHIFTNVGLQMGINHAASLATWFIACLLVLAMFKKPVENLGLIIMPLAALTLIIETSFPVSHLVSTHDQHGLGIHILLSILAYALFGLAMVQAFVLSIQERHLHNRHPGGFIRTLPPLETMETLLIQMISIGFALQTVSLLSGFVYLENMFEQKLAHKTILSIIAWGVFGTFLYGRWRFGWRGRTAVRWTTAGFVILCLAYFGSKYVLEIILN
ncbi:MAG: cytochrome c biogenesis protein CcsA [Gammaproteobacteria bacterium]|nr:cytochrome c biogenesis protein CcsA [Gammaproteobacteria bacterium]